MECSAVSGVPGPWFQVGSSEGSNGAVADGCAWSRSTCRRWAWSRGRCAGRAGGGRRTHRARRRVKFGVNTFVWGASFGPADFHLLPGIKERGFDGVEIPILDPATFKATDVRRELEKYD